MKLPQMLDWKIAQTRWSAMIEPFMNNPANNSLVLKSVPLVIGTNVINHRLGRNLQGWYPTRIRNVATALYDTQDTNQTPSLTLVLVSTANVVIDLVVY